MKEKKICLHANLILTLPSLRCPAHHDLTIENFSCHVTAATFVVALKVLALIVHY